MRRITPYLFFMIAVVAFALIALEPDNSWQTEEVSPLRAVLIVAGVFIGAHLLRSIGEKLFERWKDREE